MSLQFDFVRVDFPSLNDAIFNISWNALFVSCKTIDEIWDLFCFTLHNLFKQFVPQRRVHSFKSKINALLQDLLNLIKLKKSAWSKFRRSRSLTDKNIFRNLSTLVKRRMISVAREREANILRNSSLKTFYKYVNSKLSPCDSQHLISVDNGSSLLSPIDSASTLNNHFAKSFTADLHNVEQFPPSSNVIMPITVFSADIILPYLLGQKDTFTVGTDGLPQVLFKKCANSLCNPLSIIFS